jgi:hypothetical protein
MIRVASVRNFKATDICLEAAAGKQLLNYICMPSPLANVTLVCHNEACIDSQPLLLLFIGSLTQATAAFDQSRAILPQFQL